MFTGRCSRRIAAAVVIALLSAGAAPAATADGVDVPTPWWMSHLRVELAKSSKTRFVGVDGTTHPGGLLIDSSGVSRASAPGPSVIESTAPAQVPWSAIEKLQVGESGTTRGLLWGALAGTAAALIYYAVLDDEGDEDNEAAPALAIAGCGLAGFLIGGGGTSWETIYPPKDLPMPKPSAANVER